jgi:hypothetical protein
MVSCASATIFSDDLISATFLNRQPGKVLDLAATHPVTITRNEEAFVLLRREEIAKLAQGFEELKTVIEVLNAAYRLHGGVHLGSEHPYGWLRAFDSEELGELIEEILDAFRPGVDAGNWEQLKAVIPPFLDSSSQKPAS